MVAKNDTTGDRLVTRDSSIYKEKYESVFGGSVKCTYKSASGLCFKEDRSDTNSISAKCRKPERCGVRQV